MFKHKSKPIDYIPLESFSEDNNIKHLKQEYKSTSDILVCCIRSGYKRDMYYYTSNFKTY